MAFEVDSPERQAGEQTFPAPLPRKTIYGGIFSGYSKQFESENKKTHEKFKVRNFHFLTTHTAAGDQWMKLDKLVNAKAKVKMKWFYDTRTGVKSALAAIIAALAGEEEALRIDALPAAQRGAAIGEIIESSVGKVAAYLAGPVDVKENGSSKYIGNYIDVQTFEKPDAKLAHIGELMAPKLDITYSEDQEEPRRYLKSPKGETIKPDAVSAPAASEDENLDDAVPF